MWSPGQDDDGVTTPVGLSPSLAAAARRTGTTQKQLKRWANRQADATSNTPDWFDRCDALPELMVDAVINRVEYQSTIAAYSAVNKQFVRAVREGHARWARRYVSLRTHHTALALEAARDDTVDLRATTEALVSLETLVDHAFGQDFRVASPQVVTMSTCSEYVVRCLRRNRCTICGDRMPAYYGVAQPTRGMKMQALAVASNPVTTSFTFAHMQCQKRCCVSLDAVQYRRKVNASRPKRQEDTFATVSVRAFEVVTDDLFCDRDDAPTTAADVLAMMSPYTRFLNLGPNSSSRVLLWVREAHGGIVAACDTVFGAYGLAPKDVHDIMQKYNARCVGAGEARSKVHMSELRATVGRLHRDVLVPWPTLEAVLNAHPLAARVTGIDVFRDAVMRVTSASTTTAHLRAVVYRIRVLAEVLHRAAPRGPRGDVHLATFDYLANHTTLFARGPTTATHSACFDSYGPSLLEETVVWMMNLRRAQVGFHVDEWELASRSTTDVVSSVWRIAVSVSLPRKCHLAYGSSENHVFDMPLCSLLTLRTRLERDTNASVGPPVVPARVDARVVRELLVAVFCAALTNSKHRNIAYNIVNMPQLLEKILQLR